MPIELLSPAGDWERLQAAVEYGANAVYLASTQFGMRAAAQNFSLEELQRAVSFAHSKGVKVHLTVNTLPRPQEAMQLPSYLQEAAATGVDAFIVADLGIIALIRRLLPNAEIHASTQTGIVNHLTATELYQMGCSRVVLARELTLEEIVQIRENTPPQLMLECFVHGAMCMSVSGRCVISNYLTGRDANRGECSQPCRWSYHLVEEKRPGIFLPVFEDEHGSTILNAKDLRMIEHLAALRDAGVGSFKIEGRAKSAYYTAVATNAYRVALDLMAQNQPLPAWVVEELGKISHREYSTGFYLGREPLMQSYYGGGYVQDWEVSAIVENCENGRLFLSQRNKFSLEDTLELLAPSKTPISIHVSEIWDDKGVSIASANHPLMQISIPFEGFAPKGSLLRRQKVERI